jgi:asparagine synthase (glutamine-hydrolysing)
MAAMIGHRGPDDEDVWVDEGAGVALSHRRLSILDLSPAGRQPMISQSGQHVIVFNGEIYNHLELRRELERVAPYSAIYSASAGGEANPHRQNLLQSEGVRWRGRSDTETLLSAIEAWGVEETLKKCIGMFAFALWDRNARTLTLARDRMGEKPLYYGWQEDVFIFGSELKALKAHPTFRTEINLDPLALFFRHSYIPAPYSIYKGICKLPPGTYLQIPVRDRRAEVKHLPKPYWDLKTVAEQGMRDSFTGTEGEAVDELERLIRYSIRGQMIADVPVGVFLSGGIDSSTVVALMQAESNQPVKTFTIGFHEEEYNEADHAKAVAEHLGTDHTELYVTAEEAIRVISCMPSLYDEPFADSSQIPTFLISNLARQHVKVCLSGDGGDELFGGYTRYLLARRIWQKIGWMPKPVRLFAASTLMRVPAAAANVILSGAYRLHPHDWLKMEKTHKLQRLATVLACDSPEDLYLDRVSHWKRPNKLVRGSREPKTVLTDPSRWLAEFEFEDRMMYLDQMSYLPDDILVKVDRAAMGVSLETRVPLLDHRIVEFAWRLPLSMKIRNGESKWILRQVLYRHVPKEMVERPKMGFGMPIGSWLRGPLREWAEALLDERRIKEEGFLEPEPIYDMWISHLKGEQNWSYYLWDVLMFQSWLEKQR